jgi:hypothetical protein
MTPLRRVGVAAAAATLLVFAGLSLWYGGRAAVADADALHARWVVSEWRDGSGPTFTPELWLQTRDDLRHALQITPGNAQLYDDLGFLHATRAKGMGTPEQGSAAHTYQLQLLDEAIVSYRAATTLRPTFPYSWAYLALAKHLKGELDAEFWRAFDKAMQYGHSEAGVQPTLAQIAFARWNTVGPQRQQSTIQMVNTAQEQAKIRLLELAQQARVILP